MQFRLRTLMIALTFGPPLLAILWANWEYLVENRPGTSGFYIPANLNPLAEANLRRRLKLVRTFHSIAGIGALVFYPIAVILQWIVLSKWRGWRRPPKETKLTWIAFAAAMLLGAFCLLFVFTHPSLWGMPPGNGLNTWKPLQLPPSRSRLPGGDLEPPTTMQAGDHAETVQADSLGEMMQAGGLVEMLQAGCHAEQPFPLPVGEGQGEGFAFSIWQIKAQPPHRIKEWAEDSTGSPPSRPRLPGGDLEPSTHVPSPTRLMQVPAAGRDLERADSHRNPGHIPTRTPRRAAALGSHHAPRDAAHRG